MTNPHEKVRQELEVTLPEFNIEISSEPVVAKPRKLKMTITQEAADDLRSLWGSDVLAGSEIKPTPLQEMTEALDDPEYDPDDPESIAQWREKHTKRTPGLVEQMAAEMRDEIDREILDDLAKAQKKGEDRFTYGYHTPGVIELGESPLPPTGPEQTGAQDQGSSSEA